MGDFKCRECGEAVLITDATCPHCWQVLDQALLDRQRQQQAIKVGALFSFIMVGIIAALLAWNPEPSELSQMEGADVKAAKVRATDQAYRRKVEPAPKPTSTIEHNGPVVIGRKLGKGVVGAKLFANLEVKKHLASNPSEESQFREAGLMFGAGAHTKAIVRDVTWTGDIKVELLSGPNAGRSGWLDRRFILEGETW